MNNSALQVFAGGWEQLQHAKLKESSDVIMGFPVDLTWKPDGTKFFVLNAIAADEILEFTTITPHSTVGATETGQFTITTLESNPRGMFVHLDGTRLWIIGTGVDKIIQINMSTAWDLDTAFDPSISIAPLPNDSYRGIAFINKGLTVFLTERNDDEVREYTLTAPYDLTTFNTTAVNTLPVFTTSPNPEGIVVKTDGKMMYIISETNNTVDRYILPTPNSLAGAFFVDSLDLSITMAISPQGIFIRENDGKLIHVVNGDDDMIYTFDMSLTENNSIITPLGEELTTEAGDNLVYA